MVLVLPQVGNSRGSSTKDQIISILSQEWPLTAKQIYNRILKEKSSAISYQAVHKTILALLTEKIVVKTENNYKLNPEWVVVSKKFFEDLSLEYAAVGEKKSKDSDKSLFFSFDKYYDVGYFIIHDFYSEKFPHNGKPSVCMWTHAWPAIGMNASDFQQLQILLKSTKHYGFSRSSTVLDLFFEKFLNDLGKSTVSGVNFTAQEDTFVQGDYVAQVYFTPEFRKEFHKIYFDIKSIENIDIHKIFNEIVNKKTKISVLVIKNPDLADQIRKEAIELYEKSKKKK